MMVVLISYMDNSIIKNTSEAAVRLLAACGQSYIAGSVRAQFKGANSVVPFAQGRANNNDNVRSPEITKTINLRAIEIPAFSLRFHRNINYFSSLI